MRSCRCGCTLPFWPIARCAAIGLAYDPKVSAHFAELGLAHRSLPLTAPADEIAAGLGAVLGLGGIVEVEVSRHVERLEEGARQPWTPSPRSSRRAADGAADHGRDWLAPPPEPESSAEHQPLLPDLPDQTDLG